jgi:hypothetical protein
MESDSIMNDARSNPDKYLKSFKLTCETKNSKLQEISIDCLQVKNSINFLEINDFWLHSRRKRENGR